MEFINCEVPTASRGVSGTLASVCNVDVSRAREALNESNGDMDVAAMLIMSDGSISDLAPPQELSPLEELAEMGGLTANQAQSVLTAAGNDLDLAKANLLTALGISTIPEKFSSLKHPQVMAPCPVCFDSPNSLEQLVQLEQCGYVFCNDCLLGWITAEAEGSSSGRIQCPQQGCSCGINHAELKDLLVDNTSLFAKLDRRALELLTASEDSLFMCPSPDCSYIVSWDPEDEHVSPCATCPLCNVQRCLACGVSPFHHDLSCAQHLETVRQQQEQQDQESSDGQQGGISSAELRAQEDATLAFLQRSGMRICKQCKGGVLKSSGCDKMKCRCGYRFCYHCGAENARCGCTPWNHGFWDNITGGGDFSNLR